MEGRRLAFVVEIVMGVRVVMTFYGGVARLVRVRASRKMVVYSSSRIGRFGGRCADG
jgi:hypothetical protein